MKKITGNLINAYFVCKRQMWLYAYELTPNQENLYLELGRLIKESSYKREKEGITKEGMKIDIIKKKEGKVVVAEVKKSSKFIEAAVMQLAYYLLRLKEEGLNLKGELLIPKEKKRIEVVLNEKIQTKLKSAIKNIYNILDKETPPAVKRCKYCRGCAYFEFCFV